MPMLEEGLGRLYWPQLVKQAIHTSAHPGYRYEYFQTIAEMDEYFSKECGSDWREQGWAQYWFDQHVESAALDRREHQYNSTKIYRSRKDVDAVYEIATEILKQAPKLSCRKLAYALSRKGISTSVRTAYKIIKRFKNEQEN